MKHPSLSLVATSVLALIGSTGACAADSELSIGHKAGAGQTVEITDDTEIAGAYDVGIQAIDGGRVEFSGQNLNIDTTQGSGWGSGNVGVYAAASKAGQSVIELGEQGKTQSIRINVHDQSAVADIAVGLWARGSGNDGIGGLLHVQGETLTVNVSSDNGWSYGIYAQNASTAAAGEKARIVIDAENTVVDVSAAQGGSGIVAMSQGSVEVNGNLYVKADKAIVARGDSVVLINPSKTATVQLNGDLDFNFDKASSGTKVDSDVRVYLNGTESYWEGSATVSYDTGEPPEGYQDVSGLTLSLSDGAQWRPTVVNESQTAESGESRIALNNLEMNNGVISLSEELVKSGQAVAVEQMSGVGGEVRTYVEQAQDGSISAVGAVSIGSLSDGAALSVVADNVTADDVTDAAGTLSALAGVVDVQEAGNSQIQAVVQEGDILGEITQTFDASGEAQGAVTQKENAKLSSFASVNVINLMQWRHEMNDLNERMGELRMAPEGLGSWARVYGSSQEYGAQGTETKNTSVQVGADHDIGAGWKVGAAFSYTDSTSSMSNGDADGDMYGLALYGTWLGENGQFVDLIAKYSRISTDFAAGEMVGGYDNNAYSFSMEYGWHFRPVEIGFVEPQVELTYGQVLGDDFRASNGVRIEQDNMDSLIARAGVRAGFVFPQNKGTIYAKASVLHVFEGESAFTASKEGKAAAYSDDLGGTWYEFGLGANFNLTPSTYSYVDLEKSTGGEVKEDWRWNVGVRHVW